MKHVPLRTCVVCRNQKEKSELVRIVKAKDGRIFVDDGGRAEGRGAYVCKCESCMTDALKKKALNRVFKTQIPQETYDALYAAVQANER